ncbi:hypothetical protein QCM80_19250 [Bradyrhizobium sp. SSUT112]|uniref:hypothetical protein n=1 Tax=Bradyrhizobium sp. SSUT112 TaxID=3040604 RepID=UPI002449AAD9|nr:hypothetical protein [Bradyrhizobium sp. SSUT112]MDH2352776.1 hypothetical protein [Bradyrhizobium sp. SSUT112]
MKTETACGVPAAGSLLFYFSQLIARVISLAFLLVSAAIGDENYPEFNWLWN